MLDRALTLADYQKLDRWGGMGGAGERLLAFGGGALYVWRGEKAVAPSGLMLQTEKGQKGATSINGVQIDLSSTA